MSSVMEQRATDTRLLGALVLTFGVGWLLKATNAVDLSWQTVIACVLLALGLLMISTARVAGGSMRLALVGIALTVGLASMSSIDLPAGGFGDKTVRVASVRDLKPSYSLGVGSLTLDLTDVQVPEAGRSLAAEVSAGELVVLVPADANVTVDGHVRAGEIQLFGGTTSDGTDVRDHQVSDVEAGRGRLTLHLKVGVGTLEVARSQRRIEDARAGA